ncbi:hypothetical protein CL3_05510 [butyrate-producing bacterium SM4/1]|nr:hypothetical protein CL3_05510 [butyrate-producing bacterium SM4/1]
MFCLFPAEFPDSEKSGERCPGKVLRNTVREVLGNAARESFKKPGLVCTAENSECLRRYCSGPPGQCEKKYKQKADCCNMWGSNCAEMGPMCCSSLHNLRRRA